MQIMEGDLTRAYAPSNQPAPGRRVYVKPIHNSTMQPNMASQNPLNPGALAGTTKIAADGSVAAFVPAGRALTWQTLDPTGKSVVRERIWASFAPGEIRSCPVCHGLNKSTLNDKTVPTNEPQALRDLLNYWKTLP